MQLVLRDLKDPQVPPALMVQLVPQVLKDHLVLREQPVPTVQLALLDLAVLQD